MRLLKKHPAWRWIENAREAFGPVLPVLAFDSAEARDLFALG